MSTTTKTRLSRVQVLIVQALAKAKKPLTAGQIAEKIGQGVPAVALGPVHRETLAESNGIYAESLLGLGYVTNMTEETEKAGHIILWRNTAKGDKAAATHSTISRGSDLKVPPKTLDPVIRRYAITRTYGLESWSDTDLAQIRAELPAEYADLPLGDLRQQIVNRRKQGAFADPTERRVKTLQRIEREFGPGGTVISGFLTHEQMAKLAREIAKPQK